MKFHLSKEKIKKMGVSAIYLFGSQTQGIAGPLSDFDFGILLKNPKVLTNPEIRMKLYNELYDIFSSQIRRFVTIDIVFLDQASLQIQYQVVKSGIILYTESPKVPAYFKQRVLEHYLDFAPLRKEFDNLILQRI